MRFGYQGRQVIVDLAWTPEKQRFRANPRFLTSGLGAPRTLLCMNSWLRWRN